MRKILLVEDDVALGDVLEQKLKANDYEVKLCRDGKEGLGAWSTFKPDLVLLDIILPSMNGYEILEARQKDPELIKTPVIIISNSGQPVEINRTLALGVRDYIIKAQFDVNEVLAKVKSQFEKVSIENGTTTTTSLQGKKIVWVEDDQFLNDLVMRKLSSEGCALHNYGSGEEALTAIEQEQPDLVLLDILLPGITGFEVLGQLKKNEKTKHIPVILFSNFGQKTDVQKGEELGAARFLLKAAISLDEMVTVIKQVLAEQKHR